MNFKDIIVDRLRFLCSPLVRRQGGGVWERWLLLIKGSGTPTAAKKVTAMFIQENKRKWTLILYLFSCFLLIKCKQENKTDFEYKNFIYKNFGKEYCNEVFKIANDSLHLWEKSKLNSWTSDTTNGVSIIDSLICFNSTKDKMTTVLLGKAFIGEMDALNIFYGVKIKEHWYFFTGAHIVVPRENYQSDTHVPLSFDKLHQIAMKEVFSGYLIKDEKGNWQINERFFDELKIGEGGYWFSRCKTQEDVEKRVMEIVNNNWQKK